MQSKGWQEHKEQHIGSTDGKQPRNNLDLRDTQNGYIWQAGTMVGLDCHPHSKDNEDNRGNQDKQNGQDSHERLIPITIPWPARRNSKNDTTRLLVDTTRLLVSWYTVTGGVTGCSNCPNVQLINWSSWKPLPSHAKPRHARPPVGCQ